MQFLLSILLFNANIIWREAKIERVEGGESESVSPRASLKKELQQALLKKFMFFLKSVCSHMESE